MTKIYSVINEIQCRRHNNSNGVSKCKCMYSPKSKVFNNSNWLHIYINLCNMY